MLFSFVLKEFKTTKDRMYNNTHSGLISFFFLGGGLISNGKKKGPKNKNYPIMGKRTTYDTVIQ